MRHTTRQLVGGQVKDDEIFQVSYLLWDGAGELVVVEAQPAQKFEGTDADGYLPRQPVVPEIEPFQSLEAADADRYGPLQLVVGGVEGFQHEEAAHDGGDVAGEAVVLDRQELQVDEVAEAVREGPRELVVPQRQADEADERAQQRRYRVFFVCLSRPRGEHGSQPAVLARKSTKHNMGGGKRPRGIDTRGRAGHTKYVIIVNLFDIVFAIRQRAERVSIAKTKDEINENENAKR